MDRALIEALLRFRNTDMLPFVLHLKSRLEQARDNCTGLTGEALYRAQGGAQELKKLLESIENAPKLLDNMKNQR